MIAALAVVAGAIRAVVVRVRHEQPGSLNRFGRQRTRGIRAKERIRHLLAQPIAEGTKLRQIFVAEDGTAFVDLSKEAVTNHRGGSLDELFAVYAIVNAVTVNLPAVKGVQILIDGQEVDTLAGHVDLRHPLARNMRWVGEIEQEESTQEDRTQEGRSLDGKKQDAGAKAATPAPRPQP